MPRKLTLFEKTQQPIEWGRAIACGMISTAFMLGFMDTFGAMAITSFSYERFLGTLATGNSFAQNTWTIGLILNLILGAVFGVFYGYCFEYIFHRSGARLGLWVGVWHTLAAAFLFFPFFVSIHEFMGTGLYPDFGLLGVKLGFRTSILIVTGHLLFGASMGLFYGPVRADRIRARYFEPGETFGQHLDPEEQSTGLRLPVP